MNTMISCKRFSFCDKLSFVFLCALMADCCISGAGRILMIGPVSVRMLLFGLTILTAIPSMLRQCGSLVKNKILWVFAAWLLWLAVSTVIGIAKNNDRSVLITDLKGFAYFAILPAVMCLLSDRNRVHTLMKVMMYASGVLGLLILLHFALYLWDSETFTALYYWGLDHAFSAMSRVSDTMPRLFFYSTNYLLVGCAFATYFQVIGKRMRLDLSLLTGINLIGLLMNYTRSVYLAVGVAIAILVLGFCVFMRTVRAKRFWTHIGLSVVAFCLVLSVFGVAAKTDYVSYAVSRTLLSFVTPSNEEAEPTEPDSETTEPDSETTEPSTTKPSTTKPSTTKPSTTKPNSETQAYQQATLQSDPLRGDIQQELLNMIGKSPVIGNGLGAALEWRSENEYFYLDLTVKTGVIGLLLYLSPMLTAVVLTLRRGKEMAAEAKFQSAAWLCVLLGFMAFSYFNPYMNASLGVLFYSCTLAAVNAAMKA